MDDFATGFLAGQADNGNNNNGGWGDGWMGLIAFAMIFGGWGGGGWGGFGGGNNGGAYGVDASVQRGFDTNNIINGIRGIERGVCDLGYSTLAQSNQLGGLITTTGYGIERAIQADTVANMQNQFALSRQIGDCCCKTENMIQGLKYDMATSDCSIKTLVNQLAQQLMWGQQNGLRDLSDLINNKFCALEMSQKDQVIAELRTQLAQCGDQNMANSIVARICQLLASTGCGPCC